MCFSAIGGATEICAMIQAILQTYLIVFLPRLNLKINPYVDRFGTMHLVGSNLVMWLKVLLSESMIEIYHASHADDEDGGNGGGGGGHFSHHERASDKPVITINKEINKNRSV